MFTMNIHTNHELSVNVRSILESIAQAELGRDARRRTELSVQLRVQGFTVAMREVNDEEQTVDLYISRI